MTIHGYTYRSTIAVMGGAFMIGVSAENRAGARVAGGGPQRPAPLRAVPG